MPTNIACNAAKKIGINNKEAVFEKNGESLLVINFKNQISERSF